MNEEQSTTKRNNLPMLIVVVVLVIAAIWVFVSRRNTPEMIQPSGGDTTNSAAGIPPDSLRH